MPWEIGVMQAIQSISSPFWDAVFNFFSFLGDELFSIAILAVFYWCVDKKNGERLAFSVLCSTTLNGVFKDSFRMTRPIGTDGINSPGVESVKLDNPAPGAYEYSYSFPSGHAQTSSSLFSGIALWFKRSWVTLVSVFFMLMISLSRLYLGVHWPKDVLVGMVLGTLTTVLIFWLAGKVKNPTVLYASVAAALLVVGLVFAATYDTLKALGCVFGYVVGVWFERKFVDFSTAGLGIFKRLLRLVVGLAILAGVLFGLKAVLPATLLFGFVRYALVIFVGIGLYPLLFTKLKF